MWPERLLHISQTIREIADDEVRGELFRLAQMRTPRTNSELSLYDARAQQPELGHLEAELREAMEGADVTTNFIVNEMDWDYFTALHVVKKLERQGDLILDEGGEGSHGAGGMMEARVGQLEPEKEGH